MNKIHLISLVVCISAGLMAQAGHSGAKIDSSAIWQIAPQFLATAPDVCASGKSDNGECLLAQMTKAGAPNPAVEFTRRLYKQSQGDFGVMTGFQDQGTVSFAWVTYPLRANTNNGLLLVNGQPAILDLEDLKLLDIKTMEQSFQFRDIRNQFPNVNLWPGDRDGKTWPTVEPGPNGGSQFVLSYPLRNGCHACAHAGTAIFTWNIDASGKFLGTTFAGLLPPPLN